jgi:hypothetical protein
LSDFAPTWEDSLSQLKRLVEEDHPNRGSRVP